MADCERCNYSSKVYRHYKLAPFDVYYQCGLGRKRDECRGDQAAPSTVAEEPPEPKIEEVVAKRGSDNLNQDEISALFAAKK